MNVSIFKTTILRQYTGLVSGIFLFSMLITGCSGQEQASEGIEIMNEMDDMTEMSETTMDVTLAGGENGDADGSGTASVTIDSESGEVCYEIETADIAPPTMAHIHRGASGQSGGVVVNFNTPENGMDACVTVDDTALVNELLETPSGFYVNVHNSDHPGGAIRGQLQ